MILLSISLLAILLPLVAPSTILTVHDNSLIRTKICTEKDAPTIAIMLRNYKCVQSSLDDKYLPVIESCWQKSGFKAGMPKSDADWTAFYCNNKYAFVYKYIADRCVVKNLYADADALKDETQTRQHKIKTFISLSSCLVLSHKDHPLLSQEFKEKIEDVPKVELKMKKCHPKNAECMLNEKKAHKVISDLCADPKSAFAQKLLHHLSFTPVDSPAAGDWENKYKHCFKLVTGQDVAPNKPEQWAAYACKKDKYAVTVSKVVARCMDIVYDIDDKNALEKAYVNYPRFSDSGHSHYFRENWDRERRERICEKKDTKLTESYINGSFKCFMDNMDDPALEAALNFCYNELQTNPSKMPIPKTTEDWIKFACQWKYEVMPVYETRKCLRKMMNFGTPWIDNLTPRSEFNEDPKKIPKVMTQCKWMKMITREEIEEHSHDAEHQSHRYYPYVRNGHDVIKTLKEEDYVKTFDPCSKDASKDTVNQMLDQKKCILRIASFRKEVDLLKDCYKEIGVKMPETDEEIKNHHCSHKYPWIYEDLAILCLIEKKKWDGQIIHEYQTCFAHDLDKVILKSREWYSLAVLYEGDVRLDVNGENEEMKKEVCVDKLPVAVAEAKNEYRMLQKCQGTYFESCFKDMIGEFPKTEDAWLIWYCSQQDPSSTVLSIQMCNKLQFLTSPKGSGKQCLHAEPEHEEDVLTPDHKTSYAVMQPMIKVMAMGKARYYDHICEKKNATWIKKYTEATVSCFDPKDDEDHKFLLTHCWNKYFAGTLVPKTQDDWIKLACSKKGEIVDDTKVQSCMKAVFSLESPIVTDLKSPHYRYYDSLQNPFDESPKCLNRALWGLHALRKEEDERYV